MPTYEYDIFISHASEDKAAFAEPLATELRRWGLNIWFDRFSLKVGDSVRESIETGLSRSRYGVVIFSESFVTKFWTKKELNGLFTRETDGETVILPVWHEISAARMRELLPIQADKFALRSSDGAKAVAKALVEAVRPELLELETQKRLAYDAGSSLIEVAKSDNPGWDFSVHSGSSDSPAKPGTIATVTEGANRIDISVSDPALIPEPPSVSFAFSEQGWSKLNEFQRKGKAQSWAPGDLLFVKSNIPMMPTPEDASNLAMTVTPKIDHIPVSHARLEIGETVFPFMEMRFVRGGTDEKEVVMRHDTVALELRMVFSTDGNQSVEPTFAWSFDNRKPSEGRKVIEAMDALRNGAGLRIVPLDIEIKPLDVKSFAKGFIDDPFPESLRAAVLLVAQIESAFKANLRFKTVLSEEDSQSLTILDCLLNGTVYGNNIEVNGIALPKETGAAGVTQRLIVAGEPGALFLASTNFPGYFNLWGMKVYTPPWGIYTEKCVVKEGSVDIASYDSAADGTVFALTMQGKSPTYVRWKDNPPT